MHVKCVSLSLAVQHLTSILSLVYSMLLCFIVYMYIPFSSYVHVHVYIFIVHCMGESKALPVLYPSYSTVYVRRALYSMACDNGDSFSLSNSQ